MTIYLILHRLQISDTGKGLHKSLSGLWNNGHIISIWLQPLFNWFVFTCRNHEPLTITKNISAFDSYCWQIASGSCMGRVLLTFIFTGCTLTYNASATKHIKAEAKMPPFWRWHFQIHFLEYNILMEISLKFVPMHPTNDKSAFIKIAEEATVHYLNRWWTSSLRICVICPQMIENMWSKLTKSVMLVILQLNYRFVWYGCGKISFRFVTLVGPWYFPTVTYVRYKIGLTNWACVQWPNCSDCRWAYLSPGVHSDEPGSSQFS